VDAPDDALLAAVHVARLTAIQLHGAETPARAAALRARLPAGVELWRALGVGTRAEAEAAGRAWRGLADRLLLDAKPPPGAALPGGNAIRLDWAMLAGFAPPLPWALAGGLTPANVAAAIAATDAPMVDVSSGVEDAPGVKSPNRIAAFLAAVRAA
jgi:phosphoribosylanthranilate isomerase